MSVLQALKCLSTLQGNSSVQGETKLYQAVLKLKELGLEVLPMQFLQVRLPSVTLSINAFKQVLVKWHDFDDCRIA